MTATADFPQQRIMTEKHPPVLEVEKLQISFRGDDSSTTVVEDVSFTVGRGEVVGIVGESGSGKSVTSYGIMGVLPPNAEVTASKMFFAGAHDLVRLPSKKRRRLQGKEISMVFQEPLTSLNPLMSVGKQIAEPLRYHEKLSRKEAKRRTVEALRSVGIPRAEQTYSSYPHELSGGMRQRIMIAIALVCEPQLLIADEPTTALDVSVEAQILRLMKKLRRTTGTSILLITHDLGVIAEMADRVVVMYAGQVVEEAEVYELFREPRHPYTKALMASTPKIEEVRDELESIPGAVPTPSKMPTGCRFAARCPKAMEICSERPPEVELGSGAKTRCWLYAEQETGS
ncbi:ABC transporter ATP-binding protein [Nesterenkonia ebinurensis]|uniref:ABC transporter ATP-binding protein n=1 Tax=Nesterenkonia ebinurensis TaxID=2608252 RepID=UPI001CC48E69|nr:ABC transporter ATP-binding protein [Nesterenkonia ebinurensis]